MAGRIIFLVCCFMCSIPFLILSGNKDSATPIPFWSGSESKLKKELKDIKSYNEEMGKLYKKVAVTFVLCGVVCAIHMIMGLIALGCACTIGFYYVFNQYKKIRRKYEL
ncbi:MAG: hypothetical protein LUC90_03865 [Lachnospiraceae bacterium]|nr:hypothetical protein [Lachnospiraceae bacterium]